MKNVLINSMLAHYREIHFFAHFPASLIDADTTATSEIFSKFHSSSLQRITNNPSRIFLCWHERNCIDLMILKVSSAVSGFYGREIVL